MRTVFQRTDPAVPNTRHVHGSQDHDLDRDPSDLDLRPQEIMDPSLRFVERSTGIIDLTNRFVVGSSEIIDLRHICIFLFEMVIFKQIT